MKNEFNSDELREAKHAFQTEDTRFGYMVTFGDNRRCLDVKRSLPGEIFTVYKKYDGHDDKYSVLTMGPDYITKSDGATITDAVRAAMNRSRATASARRLI